MILIYLQRRGGHNRGIFLPFTAQSSSPTPPVRTPGTGDSFTKLETPVSHLCPDQI